MNGLSNNPVGTIVVASLLSVLFLCGEPCLGQMPSERKQGDTTPFETKDGPNLRALNLGATSAILVRPRHLLQSSRGQTLPAELGSVLSQRSFGFDLTEVEEIIWSVVGDPQGPSTTEVSIRFKEQIADRDALYRHLEDAFGWRLPHGYRIAIGEEHVVVFDENDVGLLRAAPRGKHRGMLHERLRQLDPNGSIMGVVAFDPVIQMIGTVKRRPINIRTPDGFDRLRQITDFASSLEFVWNFDDVAHGRLAFRCRSAEATAKLDQLLSVALDDLGRSISELPDGVSNHGDVQLQHATAKYFGRMLALARDRIEPRVDRTDLIIDIDDGAARTFAGVATGILLPIVEQLRNNARRRIASNTMRQIGVAIDTFSAIYGRLPTSTYDRAGRPLLSWRVHVLPYIDEQPLYAQFRLDEPWDSEHNLELLDKMPKLYRHPNYEHPNRTLFEMPLGKGALIPGANDERNRHLAEVAGSWNTKREETAWTKKLQMSDISDKPSSTIFLVEADIGRSVLWTKPDDFQFDVQNPLRGLGKVRAEGFLAIFADGESRLVSSQTDVETLRRYFDPNDGDDPALPEKVEIIGGPFGLP